MCCRWCKKEHVKDDAFFIRVDNTTIQFVRNRAIAQNEESNNNNDYDEVYVKMKIVDDTTYIRSQNVNYI